MVDQETKDWRDVQVKKTTLGFVASIAVTAALITWQASMVTGRISDLERSVQHFDNGITVQVEEDMDDIRDQIASVEKGIRDLNTHRTSDLQRFAPTWTVDGILDRLAQIEFQIQGIVEELEDDE